MINWPHPSTTLIIVVCVCTSASLDLMRTWRLKVGEDTFKYQTAKESNIRMKYRRLCQSLGSGQFDRYLELVYTDIHSMKKCHINF